MKVFTAHSPVKLKKSRYGKMKQHHFKIKIEGNSSRYTEEELTELLYNFLSDKAEFYME